MPGGSSVDSSTRLKPTTCSAEGNRALKLLTRVANQRWTTVGAIVVLGGAGLLAADAVAELLVGRFQQDEDDD